MRKLYLLFTLLLPVFLANGQVKKGALFLGGDIAYSQAQSDGTNSIYTNQSTFVIVPAIGIGIKDNLVAGVYLAYYSSKNDVDLDVNDYKENLIGGGLFLRKYKPLGKSDFSLYLQAKAGIEFHNTVRGDNTVQKGETDIFRVLANIYPGISYKIGKRLQLESGFNNLFGIMYSHQKGYNGTVNPLRFEQKAFTVYTTLENVGGLYVGFRLLFNK